MVRLRDLPANLREHLMDRDLAPFDSAPWVTGPPLAERRLALVSTAGLHLAGDQAYFGRSGAYRVIPGAVTGAELVMSHASVNFDRTGFQQDVNVAFPIDRLRELAAEGVIGSLAGLHYSFMGAGVGREELEPTGRELAGHLKADGVDSVLLVPV